VRIKLHPLLAKTKTKFFLNFISSKIAAWKAKAALGSGHKQTTKQLFLKYF
jgi:hypothetical protein